MGVAIGSYPAFLEHYSVANPESGLFGFLLYLSSDTHAPVACFASSHKAFLDELAVNRGMYLYFFVFNKKNAHFNPASYITKFFGIRLSNLPGILIFDKSDERNKKGLFFPLHIDLFKDTKRAEARLTDLFVRIGDAQEQNKPATAVIVDLALSLRRWRANERLRPFRDYAARQSARLVNLPSDIVKKLAEGFARGLVGQVN